MKRMRLGFTMIEVAIFLAITGLLFVGIAVGTQNSIFQQRYNDAVQNFVEFLRTVYSETTNVQSEGDGRSDQAIYGKLVTFGEKCPLNSEEQCIDGVSKNIYSYNVIGKIVDNDVDITGNALKVLSDLGANVIVEEKGEYRPVGFVTDYRPRWAAAIQRVKGNGNSKEDIEDAKKNFSGALLIVRHPSSGDVLTFVMKGETVEVNIAIRRANNGEGIINPLSEYLKPNSENDKTFEREVVDFCVNPNGENEGGLRRDVRLIKGAKNSSGIMIIGDGEGDRCQL